MSGYTQHRTRYNRMRYGYEDELESGSHKPLLLKGGAGANRQSVSTAGEQPYARVNKHSEYDDELQKPDGPKLWFRTSLVGVLFFILGAGLVGSTLYFYIWVGIPLALILPWFLCYAAPYLVSCMYPGPTEEERKEFNEKRTIESLYPWRITVRSVAFWALLFGGIAGVSAGYFFREYYFAHEGKVYDNLSSIEPPKTDIGTVNSFANAAMPNGVFAGRVLAFGFFPVCVAPIAQEPTQKVVSYWAVAHGPCCGTVPMKCDSFDLPVGGTAYQNKYMEFFPKVEDAVEDAVGRFGLLPDDNRVYIHWGSPNTLQQQAKERGAICLAGAFALAMLFILWKSFRGDYVKRH